METKIIESNGNERKLQIMVPNEEVTVEYRKYLRKMSKTAQVPGFRKGKAPLRMIEQMYGDLLRDGFKEEQGEKYYGQALDSTQINPVTQASMESCEWDGKNDLVAVYSFEVMPEYSEVVYENLKVEYKALELEPTEIEKTIKEIQKEYATYEEVEYASEDDEVEFEFTFLGGNENKEENKNVLNHRIGSQSEHFPEKFNQILTGRKAGDTLFIDFADFVNSGEASDPDGKIKVKITIISVKKEILPEVNDDLAKDAGFDNLAEFRANIEKDLQEKLDERNQNSKIQSLEKALVDANPLELPAQVVQNYAGMFMQEQGGEQYNDEQKQQLMQFFIPMAAHNIKVSLIYKKLKEILDIEVTEEDKEKQIIIDASEMKMEIEEYKKVYAEKISSENFTEMILERKTKEFLLEKSEIVDPPEPQPAEQESQNTEAEEE